MWWKAAFILDSSTSKRSLARLLVMAWVEPPELDPRERFQQILKKKSENAANVLWLDFVFETFLNFQIGKLKARAAPKP